MAQQGSLTWLKKGGFLILALILGGGGFYYYITQPPSCNDIIRGNIAETHAQIDDILAEIGSTSMLSAKLKSVQKQIKDIQTQINLCPEKTQIADLHQRIEDIYTQLVDNIDKQLESIKNPEKLETLSKQVELLQETIGGTIGGTVISALEKRLNLLQTKIKQLRAVLACQNRNIPKCLSSASSQLQNKLPMFCVPPAGKIPQHLQVWMKELPNSEINNSAFFIMRREVKIGEFQEYVDSLKQTERDKLGTAWREIIDWDSPNLQSKSLPDENPVASIPWWAANGYAEWLAEKTGCTLALPKYNQLVDAAISYANPKDVIIKDTHSGVGPKQRITYPSETIVLDLLGNLREWARDKCNGGHYLFGADYKTSYANIVGDKLCEAYTLDTIGFRLVLEATE